MKTTEFFLLMALAALGLWGCSSGDSLALSETALTATPTPSPSPTATPSPTPTEESELTVSDPAESQTISGLFYDFVGTCNASKTLSVTAGSSELKVLSSSCSAGVLHARVAFKVGSGPRSVTLTLSGTPTVALTRTVQLNAACPSGFIGVPGDSGLGTADFCLAKYEMKNNGSSQAISQATGSPWTLLNRSDSSAACAARGWSLISNAQWQTVARNIEAQAINWSGGSVGNGVLNRGFTDNASDGVQCAAPPCAASADDSQGYFGTGNSAANGWGTGAEQLRTHVLSNGETVWDLSGNVAEWVADDAASLSPSPSLSGLGLLEFSDTSSCTGSPCFPSNSVSRALFGPSGAYDSNQGLGKYTGNSTAYAAILRGGHRNSGTIAGIFSTDVGNSASLTNAKIGFRCVTAP